MNKILILGSKPFSKIPKYKFSKIYSSNGSAEKIYFFNDYLTNFKHTCIIGADHFLGNKEVNKKVSETRIDNLIVRGNRQISLEFFKFKPKVKYLSAFNQLNIQSKIFENFFFEIITAELKYEKKLIMKFQYFMKCLKNLKLMGISTGFFSILYAHLENPNSQLVISGIGMSEDETKYDGKSIGFLKRARIDQHMIKQAKNSFKDKIITTDKDSAENNLLKIWDGDYLN